jgi:hypothetical protein
MISGLERRRNSCQARHRPKQGEYISESARLGQQVQRRRRLPPQPFCAQTHMFSNTSPEVRMRCDCEALMCVMLQAGTALKVRGSSVRKFAHSSKYIKTTLPMFRSSTCPQASLLFNATSCRAVCRCEPRHFLTT